MILATKAIAYISVYTLCYIVAATTAECGPDSKKWLKQVPQIINHYFDQHFVVGTKTVLACDGKEATVSRDGRETVVRGAHPN